MKVFDIHSDLLTDIAWRRSRGETNVFDRIHYPRLKQGGIDSMICVIWVEPAFRNNPLARFQEVLQHAIDDLRTSKHANICLTTKDMNLTNSDTINLFLGIEGMTFIEEWLKDFSDDNVGSAFKHLHQQQFRHAIFVWNEWNAFASGTGAIDTPPKRGITHFGELAVQQLNAMNWILDVSHLDEASFWDMYRLTEQPLMASHSNAYTLCTHERNLKDEQIKAIAARDGLIGLNAFNGFIDKSNPTLESFIDHAVYIAELVGPEYIAFGFDFIDYLAPYDIGASFTGSTLGLENVTKVPTLLDAMEKRGFTPKEIKGIRFHNAFQFMKKHIKN
ncbi:Membrane dipeptidase (Peptidase family M19) [Sporosarcina pasteurii]|uniref:Membrane dipeptidase (Peptidase family M19) n=1 Tax=Sporosarcina pasteurii TaxID=1474 RepID=A0A380BD93_SPOPA|nr:Membrane dipeptidase (Peptidase family M19) [Sporosarcina pasteurii]